MIENTKMFELASSTPPLTKKSRSLKSSMQSSFESASNKIEEEIVPNYLINYLSGLLGFGYFTLMIPFRLSFKSSVGKYIIHKNYIQQILWLIVQLLILYETSSWINYFIRNKYYVAPRDCLVLAHIVGCLMYRLVCIKIYWFGVPKFYILLTKLNKLKFVTHGTLVRNKVNLTVLAILGLSCIATFTEIVLINVNIIKETGFMGVGNLKQAKTEARILYFQDNLQRNTTELENVYGVWEYVFTTLHLIGILPHFVCMSSLDKNVLLISLLSRSLVQDFLLYTEKNLANTDNILEQYEDLKNIFEEINRCFNLLIFSFVVGSLPFYPAWAVLVLFPGKTSDLIYNVQFLMFFGTFFLVMGIASDANYKMDKFYQLLSSKTINTPEGKQFIPAEKLVALTMDMSSERVALSGGVLFNLTYRVFGTIVSVVITYTLVIFQLQSSKE